MTLVVCVDDRCGLKFNNRRLSSDKAMIHDLVKLSEPYGVCIRAESEKLFDGYDIHITATDDFDNAGKRFCFVESGDFLGLYNRVERLVVYKWNRTYPSDLKFPLDVYLTGMQLESVYQFTGTSHSCITREVYVC